MKNKDLSKSKDGSEKFRVVVIGAGTGGMDAMGNLLRSLPATTQMSFVYIDRSPGFDAEECIKQFSNTTSLKVEKARQEQALSRECLYVIPSDEEFHLTNGILLHARNLARQRDHGVIDSFLISAAKDLSERMIGVILSGAGRDGVGGLKTIKIAGGVTFAQDETAIHDEMPKSAIEGGVVDLRLPPADIGRELSKLSLQNGIFGELQIGGEVSDSDEDLLSIIQLLKRTTGFDFTHYKMSTIKRRIIRRMLLYKLNTLKAYHDYLKRHANEIHVLYHDLLINVTCFFRDGDSMEYLRKAILPNILKSKSSEDQIRIWVPACSSGEEAYSLAILLAEIQEESGSKISVQIFGTDLSEIAISKARLGVYSAADLSDLAETRLDRFFVRTENNNYKVGKRIRDICVFAPHNVFKDPPFSRLDLISCCNFFIYLDNVLQQKCAALFHYALNSNGYLLLGRSETISSAGLQLFSQVEKKFKVYRKKSNSSPKITAEINERLPAPESKGTADRKRILTDTQPETTGLEKKVDDILYTRYIPAAVVINHEMEILQFRGSTGLFLEPSRGKASFSLMKMARQGLTFDLRNCIHKAQTTQKPVRKSGVKFKIKDKEHVVSLDVIPLSSANEDRLFLVIFEEQERGPDGMNDFSRDETVRKLQEELNAVRNDMQAIIDAHEANKEELQSANEEIISSNEELQSINEELETSKEEVESANEELTAINVELQMSNEQLLESQEYADAIFATIREGVLVLNVDGRVKMANMAYYRTFGAKPQDTEGRLLYEIADGQWNKPELKELVNSILLYNRQFEDFEMQYELPSLGFRTMLVNGRKVIQKANRQELMLLAFEDITDRKRAGILKAEREDWFRNMANNAPVMIWTADQNGLRNFFNVTWLTFTGRTMEQEMANGWIDNVAPQDKEAFLAVYYKAFEDRLPFMIDYRLRRFDGEYRWVKAVGKPAFSPDGLFNGIIGICTEIHDAKVAHAELERIVSLRTFDLQQVNKELKKSNTELQQFAYVASHDLQEPLRKIMIFSDRLNAGARLSEANYSYIQKISDSAQRMSQLIHDLLDFSRATRTSDRVERTDLAVILRSVLGDFDLLIKEKNALIVEGEMPVIDAIPLQMEQLFHNLISNALKFSKDRTQPVIKITSRQLARDEVAAMGGLDKIADFVEIVIEDNGIGFSNEYADQIFVLFQRLNGRHEYPGTGIGLALCRKIVDNHGGRIFASSIEGIHTEFRVILPVSLAI